MLKKPAILFFMMLYLVTATGFTVNLHYCLGQLASFKIDAPAKICTKSVATASTKCCRDRKIDIKVKDSHQIGTQSSLSKIFDEELLFILTDNVNFSIPEQSLTIASYLGPPGSCSKQPIYLTYLTFRI